MAILLAMKAIRAPAATHIAAFFTKFQQPSGAAPSANPATAGDLDALDVDFREVKR